MATSKMNLVKGIIVVTTDNKLMVKTAGAIYNLPPLYEPISFNINDKVFGIVIDNLFNIIFTLIMVNGDVIIGYYKEKGISEIFTFIEILNFNEIRTDVYNSEVEVSHIINIHNGNVKQIKIAS